MMKTWSLALLAGSTLIVGAAPIAARVRADTAPPPPTGFASGGGAEPRASAAGGAQPGLAAYVGDDVSTDEVRALVGEMLSAAQARSSLLADGAATGGHDKNFFLASADGRFRMVFSGYTQLRYIAALRDDGSAPTGVAGNDNEFEGGFQVRRTRLRFAGHVVNPDLTYIVQGEFTDTAAGGNFFLRDVNATYQLGDGWFIKGGQYKLPFVREESLEDVRRLAVEGSQATAAFNQGRSQGVELGLKKADYRVLMDFSDGFNSLNTDFATGAGAPNPLESDYAFTGRVDWSPKGTIDDFNEFTSLPDSPWVFNLGGAIHVQGSSNTRGAGGQADTTLLGSTADAMLKGAGWTFYAQFMGVSAHRPNTPPQIAAASTDDYGLLLQAGYRFRKSDEAFVRYDATFYDSDRGFVDDRQDFFTAGWNHYFAGHAAKFTLNAVVALRPTINAAGTTLVPSTISGANTVSTGQGILRSTDEGAVAIQAQMQVMF